MSRFPISLIRAEQCPPVAVGSRLAVGAKACDKSPQSSIMLIRLESQHNLILVLYPPLLTVDGKLTGYHSMSILTPRYHSQL